jgi:hypothetical protein
MSLSIVDVLFGLPVVFWAAMTVAAIILFKRKRERPERFFVIGTSLNLIRYLFEIPSYLILDYLITEGKDITMGLNLNIAFSVLVGLVGMAGFICLIYGFWVKFQRKQEETIKPLEISEGKLTG